MTDLCIAFPRGINTVSPGTDILRQSDLQPGFCRLTAFQTCYKIASGVQSTVLSLEARGRAQRSSAASAQLHARQRNQCLQVIKQTFVSGNAIT